MICILLFFVHFTQIPIERTRSFDKMLVNSLFGHFKIQKTQNRKCISTWMPWYTTLYKSVAMDSFSNFKDIFVISCLLVVFFFSFIFFASRLCIIIFLFLSFLFFSFETKTSSSIRLYHTFMCFSAIISF